MPTSETAVHVVPEHQHEVDWVLAIDSQLFWKSPFVLVPKKDTAVMITRAIRETMIAYSTELAPRSPRVRRCIRRTLEPRMSSPLPNRAVTRIP